MTVRLDVWLDVACLFRTRSAAKRACEGGKVSVNGARASAHRQVREGDQLRIGRPFGGIQVVTVRAVGDRHLPKADARAMYEDLTPAPTPEEREARRLERVHRAAAAAAGADPRQRRLLRRQKRGQRW